VRVPAGEFLMGSDTWKDPNAEGDELPQHRLRLGEYWIGKYPVTNAQYKVFVDATGHPPPGHWEGGKIPAGKENHPVVNVSWHDAAAFCAWAGLRLPTEAEWEKAARGADGRIYPWGDKWDARKANTSEGGRGGTTPVGAYPAGASPYGALDMAGNVWEWVADWYGEGYYSQSPRENPLGPASGTYRVVRGGSWVLDLRDVRAAYRYRNHPDARLDNFGFRCARSG